MSQLELLHNDGISTQALIEETRQLFNHQGSDEELIELVLNTTQILSTLCQEDNSAMRSDVA
jgi:hypothetical protein